MGHNLYSARFSDMRPDYHRAASGQGTLPLPDALGRSCPTGAECALVLPNSGSNASAPSGSGRRGVDWLSHGRPATVLVADLGGQSIGLGPDEAVTPAFRRDVKDQALAL